MGSDRMVESVRFSKATKIMILLVGGGLIAWLLLTVPTVLGPFIWGVVLAYLFSPVVDWLELRLRLPRVVVVGILYLVGIAAAVWASTAIIPLLVKQTIDLLGDLPRILTGLIDQLAFVEHWLNSPEGGPRLVTLDPQVLADQAVRSVQNLFGYVTRIAIPALFNVVEGSGQVVMGLIVTFYLLKGSRALRQQLPRLFPPPYRREALMLIADIDRVLSAYIRGQLLLIGVMAVATFIALSILHVRYSLVIALVSGVLGAIPLFGPILGGAIAVAVALFQPATPFGWSNITLALVVVAVYVVLRQVEVQVIVPNLVGPIVDLHPLFVLFALFAGGRIAGFTGVVIAVPVAAALKIVAMYLYGKIWDEPEDDRVPAELPPAQDRPAPASGDVT